MKASMRLCGVAIVTLLLPACATVTRGTKETYVIESTPPGADVALSNGQKCVTPCKLKLKRKPGFTATITKAGYEPVEAVVESELSVGGGAAAAGNVLIGGIVGGIVDGSNGSLNDLTPNPLQVTLKPVAQAAAPAAAPEIVTATASAEAEATVAAPAAAGANED
jgi:hypothetical protein